MMYWELTIVYFFAYCFIVSREIGCDHTCIVIAFLSLSFLISLTCFHWKRLVVLIPENSSYFTFIILLAVVSNRIRFFLWLFLFWLVCFLCVTHLPSISKATSGKYKGEVLLWPTTSPTVLKAVSHVILRVPNLCNLNYSHHSCPH